MIDRLNTARIQLAKLWPNLITGFGGRGAGQPSHKSRPPASLSIVNLVIEVTSASKESAIELSGRMSSDPLENLQLIVDRLTAYPDVDLIEWWTDAIAEWVRRARVILGLDAPLRNQLYGVACPYCRSSTASVKESGEVWSVPAIGIHWSEQEFESWEVHSVYCRNCDAEWVRGGDLDMLVRSMLNNQISEVLAQS